MPRRGYLDVLGALRPPAGFYQTPGIGQPAADAITEWLRTEPPAWLNEWAAYYGGTHPDPAAWRSRVLANAGALQLHRFGPYAPTLDADAMRQRQFGLQMGEFDAGLPGWLLQALGLR